MFGARPSVCIAEQCQRKRCGVFWPVVQDGIVIVRTWAKRRKNERMSNASFRLMNSIFRMVDAVWSYVDKRVARFGIGEGMTVVDYGCGPGRYTTRFARLVGENGKVFAIDIQELAIEAVKKKAQQAGLRNVEPILVSGYESTLADETADMVFALDMFFIIKNSSVFLAELRRITKKDGVLVIDDGHQRRSETKSSIVESGCWDIVEESKDHLRCKPRFG